jgi:eukaryotic-like serine/threonine-protein kinase
MAQAGPQAILQRYTLLRKIATGGMAEVYLAEQTGAGGFKKRVAIKRILPAFAEDPKFVEMFLDEARLAAMFHHPNLIQIYELGEVDGLLSLVMEYVRGLSLSELLKRAIALGAPPIPFGVAARIVADAAQGLHYAHEFQDPDTGGALGLVHRDVSPQNILLSREGVVKVMDFGIAKAAGQMHHTSTGTLKGKLAYMPPEQLNGKPLDRRADIWALGVVLYELIAGRRPYIGDSEASVFRAILQEEPPPIPALRADQRTATAGAMARQLEAFLQEGAHTTAAEVAEWMKPLLPAAGETGAGAMLTPSNLSKPATGREAGRAAASGPSSSDRSLQLPPLPPPRRPAWLLWAGGAFAGTLALGAVGLLAWKLAEAPTPADVAAPTPAPVAVAPSVPEPLPPPPRPQVAPPAPAAAAPPPAAHPVPIPALAAGPAETASHREKRREAAARHHRASAEKTPIARAADSAPVEESSGAMGSLVVNTEPWSRVTIDGRDVGQTPLPNLPLRPGRHLLVCTNPDTGLVHRETVVIPPGGRVKRLIQLAGGE